MCSVDMTSELLGSLKCDLSNNFNAVAVCAISDNEGTKSGLYPFFMPRRP